VKYLDTSFLIDLLRESNRRQPGPASFFLRAVADDDLRIDVHVVCELLAGAELANRSTVERERVEQLIAGMRIVYPDDRFPAMYGRLFARLERARRRVPPMDLLIATAAIIDSAPLVTRDVSDFSRIPGLEIESY
jgi:tRNA(fMet)-specific endonuclease VapC